MLALLGSYPLTKRFTSLCHWYLGLCLGLTPVAVLVACGMEVSAAAMLLGGSVAMWVAGFDIIYALSDRQFDRRYHLHSIPARYDGMVAVWVSRGCFVLAVLGLSGTGLLTEAGFWYWLGVGSCALLLVVEHILLARAIRAQDISARMGRIFFQANAAVSLSFLFFTTLNFLLG